MMKEIIISIVIFLTSFVSYSQYNNDYIMMMVNQRKAMSMATTVEDFQDLANNYERISNANTDKWHPLYYASLCYIYLSFKSEVSEEKDKYLDRAQLDLGKAIEIYPDESELFTLQGFLYQARLQVNPNERGREYFVLAGEALNQAKKLNPENPRTYYLMGINLLNAPKSIGGGVEAACEYFQTASKKFDAYVPDHVLSPSWGGEENQKRYNKFCRDID
jgi:tetratricopeptide (TPR) repeat protein